MVNVGTQSVLYIVHKKRISIIVTESKNRMLFASTLVKWIKNPTIKIYTANTYQKKR